MRRHRQRVAAGEAHPDGSDAGPAAPLVLVAGQGAQPIDHGGRAVRRPRRELTTDACGDERREHVAGRAHPAAGEGITAEAAEQVREHGGAPDPTTRRANSATFGVMPGISAITITAGPEPERNTVRSVPACATVVTSKSARSSSVTAPRLHSRSSLAAALILDVGDATPVTAGSNWTAKWAEFSTPVGRITAIEVDTLSSSSLASSSSVSVSAGSSRRELSADVAMCSLSWVIFECSFRARTLCRGQGLHEDCARLEPELVGVCLMASSAVFEPVKIGAARRWS